MICYIGVDTTKIFEIIRNFEYFDMSLNQVKEPPGFGGFGQMLQGNEYRKYDTEFSVVRYLKAVEDLLVRYPDHNIAALLYEAETCKKWEDAIENLDMHFIKDEMENGSIISPKDFPQWLDIYLSIKGL